jgi:hypothetical protein
MIEELEKVDEKFFEVYDSCEGELEQLDSGVRFPRSSELTNGQWHNGLSEDEQKQWYVNDLLHSFDCLGDKSA